MCTCVADWRVQGTTTLPPHARAQMCCAPCVRLDTASSCVPQPRRALHVIRSSAVACASLCCLTTRRHSCMEECVPLYLLWPTTTQSIRTEL